MNLNHAMKDALRIVGKGGTVVHLTTSSLDGNHNTVGERFVSAFKDEFIVIADMFAQKTRVNLNENPVGVITLAHPVKGLHGHSKVRPPFYRKVCPPIMNLKD
jgi:uncharacterized protein